MRILHTADWHLNHRNGPNESGTRNRTRTTSPSAGAWVETCRGDPSWWGVSRSGMFRPFHVPVTRTRTPATRHPTAVEAARRPT